MKEIKLKAEINYNFELFGIASSQKDYKLAWLINNESRLNLVKVNDHEVYLSEINTVHVSCFEYTQPGIVVRLLNNKVYKQPEKHQEYLIPELKQFDYFLLKEGEVIEVTNLTNKLKQITGLEFITKIDIMKLRSKENLIF